MSRVAETATLVHGYTMAQVDDIADHAARAYGRSHVMDWEDRRDYAWHGVVELLYSVAERPTRHELLQAGMSEVQDEMRATTHHHGLNVNTFEPGHNTIKYWLPASTPLHDFTDRLVEHMALPQVLGQLTGQEYEAIAALAATGSQKAAAAALGVDYSALVSRVKRARTRIVAVWLEHETPPAKVKSNPHACRSGHSRAEHGYIRASGTWGCRLCQRNATRRFRARERV